MKTGPILITGRSGQLAQALALACAEAGREAVSLGRDELDLADRASVFDRVGALAPCLVFNTAAYTAVDAAEEDAEAAFALNCDGARHVAEAAQRAGARLVHFSTDYVFSGRAGHPLREDERPDPLGVYGQSKLEGERAVREICPQAAIVRTSAIFSASGRNFMKTIIALAETKDEIRVVDDQITAPTPADSLARLALRLAGTGGAGLFHAAGQPATSWAGFAEAILHALARRGRRVPRLIRVSTAEFGAPAPRPEYSVLADTRLEALIGPWAIDWRPALERIVDACIQAE